MALGPNGITVVLDAMGGDHGPEVNIRGALLALKDSLDLSIILVGPEAELQAQLRRRRFKPLLKKFGKRLEIVNAAEVIGMDESASTALRKKTQSSIHIGLKLLKENRGDAFISMGHSGAVMAASIMVLGRLPEIERPAIIIKVPTASGFVFLLDAGANVDCKPLQLAQFAKMGSTYLEAIEGIKAPKIGLLSNGSESHKGNELTRQTHDLLVSLALPNYCGYVEGYDVFNHKVDLVVCDGFVGNVTLKLVEGFASMVISWFQRAIRKDVKSIVGLVLMRNLLRKFRQQFHYSSHGAAPLLGSDGLVFIGHGKSKETAISNGILSAAEAARKNLVPLLRERLKETNT